MVPPLLLTDLPSTKSLVKASVLAVGLATAAAGCGDDGRRTGDGAVGDSATDSTLTDTISVAPTCGPCCHGGTDCDSSLPPLPDSGVDAGDAMADAPEDAGDASDATPDAP